ncbi:unnamed protein product [Clonostachys chloroleuca]|uniref:Dockerin type 1 n=1 Tax=Clonostachys chloroleuca TaxID=1926264 RepID=A0AA35Q3X2_9HYPO|nr:unnamed protein product [Clonostachys chloroleuca]
MLPSFSVTLVILSQAALRTWAAPTPDLSVAAEPATFTANPNIGPGGSVYKDSAHFRIYGNNGSPADQAIAMLEGAYDCFVTTLGFRSTGLSYNDASNAGPWTKVNVYSVASLPGAAGVMHSDAGTGMAWLEVQQNYITVSGVVVHEFGHGMHYHQKTWVDQGRTGAWWETFANWFADTYKTSNLCSASRSKYNQPTGTTEIELGKVLGDSFQVLVDGSVNTGNYYQAWPFFTYITNNPDGYSGLGTDTLRQMMLRYSPNSNETPFHTLQRVAGSTSIATIVGTYWARMAYADIGHPQAQQVFFNQRGSINFKNVDQTGTGTYKVKSARQPLYMGASIIPLRASGSTISVSITANRAYTATLAVYKSSGTRYVVVQGSGSVTLASGEEATLVVANTPSSLYLYDPFSLSSEVKQGLDFSFTLTGATVA